MRELSVVGPATTPSSVCTHCLSGSCDQHTGHKDVGTLLHSPGQGQLRVNCHKYLELKIPAKRDK